MADNKHNIDIKCAGVVWLKVHGLDDEIDGVIYNKFKHLKQWIYRELIFLAGGGAFYVENYNNNDKRFPSLMKCDH